MTGVSCFVLPPLLPVIVMESESLILKELEVLIAKQEAAARVSPYIDMVHIYNGDVCAIYELHGLM